MDKASDKSVIDLYPDGSKCFEFINDLSNIGLMTWDAVYWRVKYLYTYGRNICKNEELLNFLNGCFNQGLSVNANRELYMDARKIQAALYISVENFRMASNCILAVLDITEDIPPEMFLDLTYSEIHTDLLRILKNPTMFFNDLHMADRYSSLLERQKQIIKTLLVKAAEAKSKDTNISIDDSSIEKEILSFGLMDSEEYALYKKALSGESITISIPRPEKSYPDKLPTSPNPISQPEIEGTTGRNKDGLLEIVIFPEDKEDEEDWENECFEGREEQISEQMEANECVEEVLVVQPDKKSDEQINLKNLESMLANIMFAVSENSKQIMAVQNRLQNTSNDAEVQTIKEEQGRMEAEKTKLLEQLEIAKAQLAKSEEEKSKLAQTVENQNAIIEEKKTAEFSKEELLEFSSYERVIIFDTCAIEHQLDLLDYIKPTEMVRVPKIVLSELENHKKFFNDKEKQKMGQRAYKEIVKKKVSNAFDFDESYPFLLPDDLQINEVDDARGTVNDKKIFSVAIRYQTHANIPVLLLSDDVSVRGWANAQHMENMSSEEFVVGRTKCLPELVEEKPTKEEFLSKKLKCKEYGLSQQEVSLLQSFGIRTIGDLLDKTETDLAFIKYKNGISATKRIAQVQKSVKRHYDGLFCKEDISIPN